MIVDAAGPAGAEPVFESGAILIYLAEAYGPELLPAAGPARYAVLKWLIAQVANIGPMFGQHSHFRGIAADNPYAAARFRKAAAHLYNVLEDRLALTPWLAGDAYSIADIATWPWARYLKRHGFDLAAFPALAAWGDRIAERPAVRRADRALARLAAQDLEDRANATAEETARFYWLHIDAPDAAAAAIRYPS